ncbi:hypothetical protein HDU87_002516 [Geranomyces variabilis]|uniref:Uncharacterized protein n=1 Tax=Geranomyces variabilis TaxID=109894 RepID=A0AAD5TRS3_9FUNG|nr:hypothetical protein HDU87_002516 [Geranomyces variabilis]
MRFLAVRPRRFKSRHVAVLALLSAILLFRKWLYCIGVVIHCFATWNIRPINYIGSHADGFPLDLLDLPPPADLNVTDLLAARHAAATASRQSDLEAANQHIARIDAELKWGPDVAEAEMVVPPILHQIVLGMTGPTPPKWTEAANACTAIHPHWTVMVWNDAAAEEFIKVEHSWFYDTWINYRYNIQKADSLRYLVLYTYGGTYLDMDLQCLRPLDPFRKFEFLANAAHPVGVSNGFIMTAPKSKFMAQLVENLKLFNRFFFTAYPTVMFSTGCMYVSAQHAIADNREPLKVLGGQHNRLNGAVTTPLFKHLGASSWHRGDAKLFVTLGKIIKAIMTVGQDEPPQQPPLLSPDQHHQQQPPQHADTMSRRRQRSLSVLSIFPISAFTLAFVACFRFIYMRRRRAQRAAAAAHPLSLKSATATDALVVEKRCPMDSV